MNEDGRIHIPDPENDSIKVFLGDGTFNRLVEVGLSRRITFFAEDRNQYLIGTFNGVILLDAEGDTVWSSQLPLGALPRAFYTHQDYIFVVVPNGSGEATLVLQRANGAGIGYLVDTTGERPVPMVIIEDGRTVPAVQTFGADGEETRLVHVDSDGNAWYSAEHGGTLHLFVSDVEANVRHESLLMPMEREWTVFDDGAIYFSSVEADRLVVRSVPVQW
ncbi:MAG: hypothetical protein ACLFP4_10305 [Spirochaetales bacterium]